MESTLTQDDTAFVEEFRRIVAGAVGDGAIPPTDLEGDLDRRFALMAELIGGGGWDQAAAQGASEEPAALLTAMVESAARPSPTVCYPLVEMWLAQRFLAVAGSTGAGAPSSTGLVLGDATAVLGISPADVVWPFADRADELVMLIAREDGAYDLVRVDARRATWEPVTHPDVTLPAWRLANHEGAEHVGRVSADDARRVAAEQLLFEAAEMLGCAQGLFDATKRHVSSREQFGQVIAAFQAVRHRLADAHVQLETVRSLVAYGAWVADSRSADPLEFALMAKGVAGETCWDVANEAIQFHGAMGFTWEMNLQHPTTRIITRALAAPASAACLEAVGRSMRGRGGMVGLVE